MSLLKNLPPKQPMVQMPKTIKMGPTPGSDITPAKAKDNLVLIDKPISTGFMLGIGIQLSILVFTPILACLAGIGFFILGAFGMAL